MGVVAKNHTLYVTLHIESPCKSFWKSLLLAPQDEIQESQYQDSQP